MIRVRLCLFALLVAVLPTLLFAPAVAQTASPTTKTAESSSPAPKTFSCPVRHTPLSPGEIAFAQEDLPKAETLLRAETKAPGIDGDRAHNALIRVLLRQEKFDQAATDADSWFSAAPKNSWASISVFEVHWRQGHVVDAYTRLNATIKLDPCNPRSHAEQANVLLFSSMYASAQREINSAHGLDPLDDSISRDWVYLQPRSQRLHNLIVYLNRVEYLSPDQKQSLDQWRSTLSAPPVQHCHLAGNVASAVIPYRALQNGPNAATFWGLDVAFNGKPRRLEIDTGAHGLLLTRAAANALHLEIVDRGKDRGIGDDGDVPSHTSFVKTIKIGPLTFEDCKVSILEKRSETLDAKDGLIGGDVFSDFALTLDFPGRVLKLDPLPPLPGPQTSDKPSLETDTSSTDRPLHDRYVDPSMKDWVGIFRSGHDLILPVQLNGGPYRLFIMDTGSQLNLISWQTAKEVAHVSKGSDFELHGISGTVKQTYTTGPVSLTFANMRQTTTGMVALDTGGIGRDAGVDIAGFIGAPTLHQLTVQIDYRDSLVHFSFDPNRLSRCVPGMIMADCY